MKRVNVTVPEKGSETMVNTNKQFNIYKYCDMMRGSQDQSMEILNNNIILVGGYCNTISTPYKTIPQTNHTIGFINEIFCYSIENNSWKIIGKIPIHPRQRCQSIVLGNKMYVWGGFSYTPLTAKELQEYKIKKIPLPSKNDIYSYADGCCLSYDNNTIKWHDCPNLPFPLIGSGLVDYKKQNKLYFLNGAIYDKKSFNTFITIQDTLIGKMFFSLSYDESYNIIPNSIEYINNFPGTPRCSASTHIIDNFIYVLGGINTTHITNKDKGYLEYTYNNVIDNWRYNINENNWEKLPNISIPICNQGSVLYDNRYIILMGGLKYNTTYIDNTTIDTNKIINTDNLSWMKNLPYNNISNIFNPGVAVLYNERSGNGGTYRAGGARQYNGYFSNIIIIYDIVADNYVISDTFLPLNINTPKVILHNKNIYIAGGEGNPTLVNNLYYGNCISLLLKITINKLFI